MELSMDQNSGFCEPLTHSQAGSKLTRTMNQETQKKKGSSEFRKHEIVNQST